MKARGPGQSSLLLLDVTRLLQQEQIDHAVVGAVAAAVHGAIRATTDADALLSVSMAEATRLRRVFAAAGFQCELRRGDAADPIPALLVLTDRHGNRVDLLAGLKGSDPELYSRTMAVPFQGGTLPIVGREDFIAMKCYAGGPQDLADARMALQGRDTPLDLELLRRVTRRFGRAAADALEDLLAS